MKWQGRLITGAAWRKQRRLLHDVQVSYHMRFTRLRWRFRKTTKYAFFWNKIGKNWLFQKLINIHTSYVQELPTLEKVQKTVIFLKKIDKNCKFFKVCHISKKFCWKMENFQGFFWNFQLLKKCKNKWLFSKELTKNAIFLKFKKIHKIFWSSLTLSGTTCESSTAWRRSRENVFAAPSCLISGCTTV